MMPAVTLPTPRVRPRDDSELAAALRATVRGEVRFDLTYRAAYSTDASNYRQVPLGVVLPLDVDDVIAAVAVCNRFGAPVLCRGGGTSLAGQCTNTAVVLDFSAHVNQVESVDPARQVAIVQTGTVLDTLNDAAKQYRLTFGPKPATHDHCTLGGMIGNNSCGATAQWSGTTASNVRRLDILTYDGLRMWVGPTSDEDYQRIQAIGGRRAEIYRRLRELAEKYEDRIRSGFPDIPRRISGYNLPVLLPENHFDLAKALVGSESTCVIVLRAEVDLLPEPPDLALLLFGYPDIATAAEDVPIVNSFAPYVVEGLDHKLIEYEEQRRLNPVILHEIPPAGAWLMVKASHATADELREAVRRAGRLESELVLTDSAHIKELDSARELALGATARVPGFPDTWPGWEDSAVAPERLAGYLRDLTALLHEYGLGSTSLYGHFGHGCVHASIPFALTTPEGIAAFRSFVTAAARLVVAHGGSLSGEHGDGQARGELLDIMYGPDLIEAMREFKAIFDPDGRMNPGKVMDPNPLDQQLRLGTGWQPMRTDTGIAYPDDGGFAGVPTRCFGVGACRRTHTDEGTVMCPSYQVTGAEEHSTRGRMRLLYEMMRGETITDGWRSTEVRDALDLCLACKGCASDCPVSVDMATYKAEFLSHHYRHRVRPRAHYSLGWLPTVARAAALAPTLANAVAATRAAKWLAGVDRRRSLPAFARRTFVASMRSQPESGAHRADVMIWPDTFTNHFAPHIGLDAVEVLRAAGFSPWVPRGRICCGLTWLSTGQLGRARHVLAASIRSLGAVLAAGTPIIGLEPSCTAMLRSGAVDLLAGGSVDEETIGLAKGLADRVRTFAEFLTEHHAVPPAGPNRQAVVQRHCHQHARLGFDADRDVLERVGITADLLDSGCCGLAGDFGMTPDHWDVSMACAERVLFPALRDVEPDTLVVADGFSCRLQISGSGVAQQPMHLAEVVAAQTRSDKG
jgi:FAD/FMN-containing dehydrogenase/Fe-S oxidoreductase